jgi:hypothetical protein
MERGLLVSLPLMSSSPIRNRRNILNAIIRSTSNQLLPVTHNGISLKKCSSFRKAINSRLALSIQLSSIKSLEKWLLLFLRGFPSNTKEILHSYKTHIFRSSWKDWIELGQLILKLGMVLMAAPFSSGFPFLILSSCRKKRMNKVEKAIPELIC